jgi:hypothetical protein
VGSKAKPVIRKERPALSRNCEEIPSPSQDDRQKRLNHALADRSWKDAKKT